MQNKLLNCMDEHYTPFEQNLALSWAQAHLSSYLSANPNCTLKEKEDHFLDALDGGLSLALELRQRNV